MTERSHPLSQEMACLYLMSCHLGTIMDTDASDVGIGVLSQIQDGVEKVIAYSSWCLSKS